MGADDQVSALRCDQPDRRPTRWRTDKRAATLSVGLLGAACGVVDDAASPPSVFPPQATFKSAEIPAPPANARWLPFSAIPEAVRLLGEIQHNPRSPSARAQLAAIYQEQGFVGAESFYERTAELLMDSSEPRDERLAAGSWLMTEEEANGEYSDEERLAADLISQGRLDEALETAGEVLERAYSLQLAAEWSYAAIRKATVDPSSVSMEALELAFRTLLTGLEEESMPRPVSFFDRYSGYWDLSNAFTALEDYPSALVSARLALNALRDEMGPEDLGYRAARSWSWAGNRRAWPSARPCRSG